MKKYTIPALLSAIVLVVVSSCASTPTAFDRQFAEVRTNYVPVLVIQTNVVTMTRTNEFIQTVVHTNEVGVPVPVYVTNIVIAPASVTNYLIVTNIAAVPYLVPNTNATAIAGSAGAIVNSFVPGLGSLVTEGLLAALTIFLGIRNRQFSGRNSTLSQAAGVLTQIIETGREVLSKTPQGQQAADAFTAWMVTHQAQTDTIAEISRIVQATTNNTEAQQAANQILQLIGRPTTPPAA